MPEKTIANTSMGPAASSVAKNTRVEAPTSKTSTAKSDTKPAAASMSTTNTNENTSTHAAERARQNAGLRALLESRGVKVSASEKEDAKFQVSDWEGDDTDDTDDELLALAGGSSGEEDDQFVPGNKKTSNAETQGPGVATQAKLFDAAISMSGASANSGPKQERNPKPANSIFASITPPSLSDPPKRLFGEFVAAREGFEAPASSSTGFADPVDFPSVITGKPFDFGAPMSTGFMAPASKDSVFKFSTTGASKTPDSMSTIPNTSETGKPDNRPLFGFLSNPVATQATDKAAAASPGPSSMIGNQYQPLFPEPLFRPTDYAAYLAPNPTPAQTVPSWSPFGKPSIYTPTISLPASEWPYTARFGAVTATAILNDVPAGDNPSRGIQEKLAAWSRQQTSQTMSGAAVGQPRNATAALHPPVTSLFGGNSSSATNTTTRGSSSVIGRLGPSQIKPLVSNIFAAPSASQPRAASSQTGFSIFGLDSSATGFVFPTPKDESSVFGTQQTQPLNQNGFEAPRDLSPEFRGASSGPQHPGLQFLSRANPGTFASISTPAADAIATGVSESVSSQPSSNGVFGRAPSVPATALKATGSGVRIKVEPGLEPSKPSASQQPSVNDQWPAATPDKTGSMETCSTSTAGSQTSKGPTAKLNTGISATDSGINIRSTSPNPNTPVGSKGNQGNKASVPMKPTPTVTPFGGEAASTSSIFGTPTPLRSSSGNIVFEGPTSSLPKASTVIPPTPSRVPASRLTKAAPQHASSVPKVSKISTSKTVSTTISIDPTFLFTDNLYQSPTGNISILVNHNGKRVRGEVSACAMSLASPVWKNLLFPPHQAANGSEANRIKQIGFAEEDSAALLVILDIVHLRFRKVPSHLDYMTLLQVAVLCNEYECVDLARPWLLTNMWLEDELNECTKRDQVGWLFVAYTFGREEVFKKLAMHLVMSSAARDQPELKALVPTPEKIIDNIFTTRLSCLTSIISTLQTLQTKYSLSTPISRLCIHNDGACDALYYGSISLAINRLRLHPGREGTIESSLMLILAALEGDVVLPERWYPGQVGTVGHGECGVGSLRELFGEGWMGEQTKGLVSREMGEYMETVK